MQEIFPGAGVRQEGYGLVVHQLPCGAYHFRYDDDTRFVIRADGGRLWANWPAQLTLEDAATYLLGPVMAFVLRLHGILSLHAGAVTMGDGAAVICGPAGAGKSTTAAAFARMGVPVLSDDLAPVVRTDCGFLVRSTYPHVRLWETATAALFGAVEALPKITAGWDKRYFDAHRDGVFEAEAKRLHAIFLLADRECTRRAPRIEPVSAREAFVAILANLHSTRVDPRGIQQAMFTLARDLVATVPVQRVVPHTRIEALPDLCRKITEAAATH
jgi:hypothetical protein